MPKFALSVCLPNMKITPPPPGDTTATRQPQHKDSHVIKQGYGYGYNYGYGYGYNYGYGYGYGYDFRLQTNPGITPDAEAAT